MRLDSFLTVPVGAVTLAVLTACGGGSGSSALNISGTAATGAAMANATVKVQCAAGTASITAAADGTYKASLAEGKLPCLIQASDGTNTLHSVADGSGSSSTEITANINPVTELIVAQALGSSDTAAAFNAVAKDSAVQGKLTAEKLQTAIVAVQDVLKPVDTTIASTDFLKKPLKAATSTQEGDATDKLIDKVVTSLGQINPSAQTVQAQVKAFSDTLASTASGLGAAAAKAQITPPVATCPALRNMSYRTVDFGGYSGKTTTTDWSKSIKVSWYEDASYTSEHQVTPHATEACRFTLKNLTDSYYPDSEAFVAPSGLAVIRTPSSPANMLNQGSIAIAFPVQKFSVADLAGTWSFASFGQNPTTQKWENSINEVTFDNTGKVTDRKDCSGIVDSSTSCSQISDGYTLTLSALEEGSAFGLSSPNVPYGPERLFAFRNSKGMVLVQIGGRAGIAIGTKKEALALPAVGSNLSYWSAGLSGASTSNGFSEYIVTTLTLGTHTFNEVDATTNTVSRTGVSVVGDSSTNFTDSLVFNKPRIGWRYKAPVSQGAPATLYLPITGMGVSVSLGSGGANAPPRWLFSVTRP